MKWWLKVIAMLSMSILFIAQTTADIQRGRDPWVFRINLDDHVRSIVLALNDHLWVAYDPERGGLYKIWKNGVHFRGPAFDHVHRVQPGSIGEGYATDSLHTPQWLLTAGGKETAVVPQYLGYHLKGNAVTLRYAIATAGPDPILIEERPEFIENAQGMPGLERRITLSNVPQNVTLRMRYQIDHLLAGSKIETNGKLTGINTQTHRFDWGSTTQNHGILQLNPNTTTFFRCFFDNRAVMDATKDDGGKIPQEVSQDEFAGTKSDDGFTELSQKGKILIGQNDCAACHEVNRPLIGPSYIEISKKYTHDEANIQQLAGRVIDGSSGVWGIRIMSPHPQLSKADAQSIVSYILSLTEDSEISLQPGLVADYYDIGLHLFNIPEVMPGQSPNHSIVVPNIEFESGNPDLEQNDDSGFHGYRVLFAMTLSGFINVDRDGDYKFEMEANNGARLFIDDQAIMSSVGEESGTGKIFLKAGTHPIRIDYFQDLGTKSLILSWKTSRDADFVVVPPSAFTHDPNEVKPTSPGVKQIYRDTAPGFGATLESMHPGFDLMPLRPDGFEPRVGGIDFMSDGRMIICTWDGDVFFVQGVQSGDPSQVTYSRFAEGLAEPLGIAVVDDRIYVIQRWELTELIDQDQDGIADEYRVVCDDWKTTADFHEWSFGLAYKDDYFYANLGIAQGRFYQHQARDRGTTIKIHKDGSYEFIGFGLRAHNGIGFATDGALFATDNEGDWVPANKMVHLPLNEKTFYGNRAVIGDSLPGLKQKRPVIWLTPYEIGNSPSQPAILNLGPYQNQTIHGDITHGGIKRDYVEKVRGQYQGAVFRFAHGFEAGVNRLKWGPDGALYVGGLGSAQDYGYREQQTGLERMVYNGKPAFEMLAVRAKSNGFEIEFTEPVRIGDGTDAQDYFVQQWGFDERGWEGFGKVGLENLEIRSVSMSDDRTRVFLEMPGIKEEKVVYFRLEAPFISDAGRQLWSNEAWYTLNLIPEQPGLTNPWPYQAVVNRLTPPELQAGWVSLFDGKSLNNWKNRGRVSVANGALVIDGKSVLYTVDQFTNFELEMEWTIASGSEGGVYFGAREFDPAGDKMPPFPRMQIIDDRNHPDAKIMNTHLSGANYDLIAPKYKISRPSGEYNHARLVVKDGLVSHWLNGIKMLEYKLGSPELKMLLKNSIYRGSDGYGKSTRGSIALQCNTGEIRLRNVRIREL